MTLAAKSLLSLATLVALAQLATAQNLIPPPGPPQSGYYIEFSDETTIPVGAPNPVAPSVWQAPLGSTPTVTPAGCNHCTELWAGACDEATGGTYTDAICDDGTCDMSCATECCSSGCGLWSHCSSVYGSLLYLRARNADVAYAVPIDGPITSTPANNPLQVGRVGVVDPDYEPAFEVGFNLAIDPMTSLYGQLMMLDSWSSNSVRTTAPDVLRSLVSHPSSTSAATDFLSSRAELGIQLDTVDAGLRHLFVGGQCYAVNYSLGARYSRLEQTFDASFVDNGRERVATGVDFDGGGLRLGLEAERQSCAHRLRVYSRGGASFLAGKFRGKYFQGQSFDPTVVNTSWEAGRIVPILDLELGAGWCSPGGCLRFNAGYLVSAWFNTVTTDDFIGAVQANDFDNLGDRLTFDGLRAQVEWRF